MRPRLPPRRSLLPLENREAALLQNRARGGRFEKFQQMYGARLLAAHGQRNRIDNRRMRILREYARHLDGGVGGHQGTLAGFAAVDAALLASKPANLSMREAAALPLVFITA